MIITDAHFVTSSTHPNDCPAPDKPEYAFIGRSNVGKSSLLNMLCNRHKLAKTSGTPGKTRLINHFLINNKWYMVDLPGYGYAKLPKAQKGTFTKMIDSYLFGRPNLVNLFVLIDSRHSPMKQDLDFILLHTGQHYSYEMDRVFFENLNLPDPNYNLDVGSGNHGEQTGKMLIGIENVLLEENPDVVLVQGDTNTVAAGTLAASKLGIKVGHVEAGLRSFDRTMPEELNRILSDHLSDYLFAPTQESVDNLLKEGIDKNNIHLAYNTITDAVYQGIEIAEQRSTILKKLNLKKNSYFLVTAHRQENVDIKDRLHGIFHGLDKTAKSFS
ncbi:MAG: hypothetical protein PWQ17_501, partial [Anaerophaga sp.]|nr:hypothetical protein [Anaerophaga sp.]